jgi:hypothetical protein
VRAADRGEIGEEIESRPVRPVQVLDHENQDTLAGDGTEEVHERREQPLALPPLAGALLRTAGTQLGQQPGQLVRDMRSRPGERVRKSHVRATAQPT